MDEASKLVSELQHKLSELDLKVWKYRRDMAAEFEKYAESLLRDVPKDVSETVSKTMAEAMKGCTSLYPAAGTTIESCATGTSILENGASSDNPFSSQPHASPIPAPRRKHEIDMDGSPRSPHERENEFRGVFTPSYLPLLDSTNRNERRSSRDQTSSPAPSGSKDTQGGPTHADASTDTRSLVTTPEPTRPPTPRRRNTDEVSIASVASDHSEGTVRRSALRRSSDTSTKERTSPRRVRFEVAGEEVLPTASPQPESTLGEETVTSLFSDGDDEAGSEQIEDIDQPPPKRISSTQALRALSRASLEDDGTQWTTVTSPPDGSAAVAISNGLSLDSSSEDLYMGNGVSRPSLGHLSSTAEETSEQVTAAEQTEDHPVSENTTQDSTNSLSDGDDDDDMLDMPPLKRQSSSRASMMSPTDPPNIDNNKSPTASTRPNKAWQGIENFGLREGSITMDELKFGQDDDDVLFQFEENLENQSPQFGTESPPEDLDDEERDSFDTEPVTYQAERRDGPSAYSSSPARPIIRNSRQTHSEAAATTGLVGSYKGRPFSMPIVSPEIHAQAASFGPVSSFVGSVNGRSGMDASDVQSYRATSGVGSFSGTPRSMSERLMMDEMMKANKAQKK